MKTIFNLIVLLLLQTTMNAISDVKCFNIHGNVYELSLEDSVEKGILKTSIEVWSGNQLITTVETGPKGKYKVDLAYYPHYTLKFGKAPYITKIVEIDTKGFDRAAEFGIVNLDLDVSLFRDEGYMGIDFMSYTPVAKGYFNKKKGKLEWDENYSQQMTGRIRGVIMANRRY